MARYGITHHKAISVTSGYWVGAADSEREIINISGTIGSGAVTTNSILSGNVTTATIASGAITLPKFSTTLYDYGITGQSGHITSLSTRLTTISWGHANNKGPLATANSGINIHINWSGGAIDVYKYSVDGSAATSSQVIWSVWGE